MAEGDITVYNDFKERLFHGVHILSGTTVKLTLHTGYTPNIDTHQVWADSGVSSTEYGTAAGYTAGGKTLTGLTVTQDNTNDRAAWDADDVTWTSLGALTPATPSHAILWNDTPTAPADPLIAYIVLGTTATNGGNYTIQWHANGILLLT
jgi:hypothetical protein